MPLIATRGAASAQGFGEFAQVTAANYIEDVFSCFLYTGTGAALTITNNIDLSTKGGLVWIKQRSSTANHMLTDTARGTDFQLSSNSDVAQSNVATRVTAFNADGFNLGASSAVNGSASTYASWTFREQPKFFDIVTYTGNGANRTIAHSLGSVPGSIWVKRTDTTGDWQVYHRSLANTQYLVLNSTAAAATGATRWNSTTPTSSVFSVGTDATVNASAGTYIAYLFAHNAGGFGLTGTDNVISCGSFTTDGSGNASVNLGYEPQFWLYKPNLAARYWTIYDTMRGWSQTEIRNLAPNRTDAEGGGAATAFYPTATGFDCVGSNLDASTEHIYIAIRRGPMKVPTDATTVFKPLIRTGNGTTTSVTAGFAPDMAFTLDRDYAGNPSAVNTKLIGPLSYLNSAATDAESSLSDGLLSYNNTGIVVGADSSGFINYSTIKYVYDFFCRAPGFFDVVCYTGAGSGTTVSHNLAAAPELIITKRRDSTSNWGAFHSFTPTQNMYNYLDLSGAGFNAAYGPSSRAFQSQPTSTQFITGGQAQIDTSGGTYVAYLFATCAGVSKVGSYTGNGTTQTINCGFTGGARFVLIKRTDSTGDWYVYDTARGMTTLTDPYLFLNSTAAEVATLGSVTTVSTGFALNSTILAAINVNAGTYIFLAIA